MNFENIIDETGEVQQSIEDIPRNNYFKITSATCCVIHIYLVTVDMKVYALQLNQNSTADVFHAILPNFRIILEGCFLQENRGGERFAVTLWFYVVTFSRKVIHKSWNNLLSPQSFPIWIMLSIFKKGLSSLVFTIKILEILELKLVAWFMWTMIRLFVLSIV